MGWPGCATGDWLVLTGWPVSTASSYSFDVRQRPTAFTSTLQVWRGGSGTAVSARWPRCAPMRPLSLPCWRLPCVTQASTGMLRLQLKTPARCVCVFSWMCMWVGAAGWCMLVDVWAKG